jgi:hypothetical protein
MTIVSNPDINLIDVILDKLFYVSHIEVDFLKECKSKFPELKEEKAFFLRKILIQDGLCDLRGYNIILTAKGQKMRNNGITYLKYKKAQWFYFLSYRLVKYIFLILFLILLFCFWKLTSHKLTF